MTPFQRQHRRIIAYNSKDRVYLSGSCSGTTPDRTWAWSGSAAQAVRMVEVYGLPDGFRMYWDGDERATDGAPIRMTRGGRPHV